MNPACEACRGACCERFVLPKLVRSFFEQAYLKARGEELPTGQIVLPCRCPKLDMEGLCVIYDRRPTACEVYPVGGPACLAAIDNRRSHADGERIRGLMRSGGRQAVPVGDEPA